MARTETLEPDTPAEEPPAPMTAVGYDANGETIDVPVDTRPAPELPGFEAESDPNAEFFEGKRVIGHKWSFSGNYEVNPRNAALAAKLEQLRNGKPVLLLVEVEPGDVAFAESTEDGHVRGVFHKRKLHVTGVMAAYELDTEALFEGGLVRVRREREDEPDADQADDGNIGYLTQEPPPGAEDQDDLASALMEAGICGKRHGSPEAPTCRMAAHACERQD